MKYLSKIFEAIKLELEASKPRPTTTSKAPVFTPALEVLQCIKLMFRNYGDEFRSYFDSL